MRRLQAALTEHGMAAHINDGGVAASDAALSSEDLRRLVDEAIAAGDIDELERLNALAARLALRRSAPAA